MSLAKKVIAVTVSLALAAGAAAGGLYYLKKKNVKTCMVVSVASLAQDDYYSDEDSSLTGTIATNVTQQVTADSDTIVQEVYVSEGQAVAVGDPLISFDTTLIDMKLDLAKLKKQQHEVQLETARKRLTSLQNGGPITDSSADADSTDDDEMTSTTVTSTTTTGIDDMEASIDTDSGYVLAMASPILLAEVFDSDDSSVQEASSEEEVMVEDTEDELLDDTTSFSSEIFDDSSSSYVIDDNASGKDLSGFGTGESSSSTGSDDGPVDYESSYNITGTLDADTKAYCGTGTEKDPYIFLCTSRLGYVTLTAAFLNKMAGYVALPDGGGYVVDPDHPTGYWYQLEFHTNDTVGDVTNRKASCTGYFLRCGAIEDQPHDESDEDDCLILYVSDASTYTSDEEVDEEGDVEETESTLTTSGTTTTTTTVSRAAAIKNQEITVKSLELTLQQDDIDIARLEKQSEKKMVTSKIDGIVTAIADTDEELADGTTLLSVKSKQGYYVKGTVSELYLDRMKEGTSLNCTSYISGTFTATVIDVTDYPVSSDSSYMYYDSNPNASSYGFSASIDSDSSDMNLTEDDYLTIAMQKESDTEDGDNTTILIDAAFVRSEGGMHYVYKSVEGKLVKQYVKTGETTNSGSAIYIEKGLSYLDYVAFPYGSNCVEGVKTYEGTTDELW